MKFEDIKHKDTSTFKNLLIVDGLNLAFRWKHYGSKTFAVNFVQVIESFARSYEANKVLVLGDWGSDFRKEIYPEYKANRIKMRENQTEEEADAFKQFLSEFDKASSLIANKYPFIKLKGVEADDIAAYITKYYADKFDHIWLVSSDRDWNLLINDKVSQFSYKTRKEYTKKNWNEHYDYDLEDHISIKVLVGDTGDNIPGIEGVGHKRACGLVNKYGNALDIYCSIPLPGTQKFIKKTNEFKDKLLLNYELMDLMTYCEKALLGNEKELNRIIGEYI